MTNFNTTSNYDLVNASHAIRQLYTGLIAFHRVYDKVAKEEPAAHLRTFYNSALSEFARIKADIHKVIEYNALENVEDDLCMYCCQLDMINALLCNDLVEDYMWHMTDTLLTALKACTGAFMDRTKDISVTYYAYYDNALIEQALDNDYYCEEAHRVAKELTIEEHDISSEYLDQILTQF